MRESLWLTVMFGNTLSPDRFMGAERLEVYSIIGTHFLNLHVTAIRFAEQRSQLNTEVIPIIQKNMGPTIQGNYQSE